jgi:hypothetical protein
MRFLPVLFCAALSFLPATLRAQTPQYDPQPAGVYDPAQLDSLLAPVALYPDAVLAQLLAAAATPDQVAEAAYWTRMNRGMTGDDAVRAVQDRPWQPAVKALVAYPDLLERMADSPQWTVDLGNAYLSQPALVMATVQTLRERAYASGYLHSDAEQTVQYYGSTVSVLPAVPNVYYVRYYDPLVVYGSAWRPVYRPVYWRPWAPRPVFVTNVVVPHRVVVPHSVVAPRAVPRIQGNVVVRPYHRIPEANRQPIVQSRGQPIVQSRVAPAFSHPAFSNPSFQNHSPLRPAQPQHQRQQHPHRGYPHS